MEEEQNIEKAALEAEQEEAKRDARDRERHAAYARKRTASLRALGLSARGKPLKDRHKSRDPEKQRKYQAAYGAKQKAARKRLGLSIAEFMKLPRATRLMELNHPRRGKAGRAVAKATPASNGPIPAPTTRDVKFCPHCGWNIDATRKAQAFIDGRVA